MQLLILLDKLHQYRIHGIPYNLIKSYHTDRTYQVKMTYMEAKPLKAYLSNSLPVKHGVLQGSIPGPLLFIIYVNDFTELKQVTYKFSLLISAQTNN